MPTGWMDKERPPRHLQAHYLAANEWMADAILAELDLGSLSK
jgi:hypothetical protein